MTWHVEICIIALYIHRSHTWKRQERSDGPSSWARLLRGAMVLLYNRWSVFWHCTIGYIGHRVNYTVITPSLHNMVMKSYYCTHHNMVMKSYYCSHHLLFSCYITTMIQQFTIAFTASDSLLTFQFKIILASCKCVLISDGSAHSSLVILTCTTSSKCAPLMPRLQ